MAGALSEGSAGVAAKIGPGRVVLIVGPSGAGKDTLIGLARSRLPPDARVAFPKRCVTREASASEDNIVITPDAFVAGIESGAFILHWRAHGVHYAIPVTIAEPVSRGETVVLNVSRTVVADARASFANVGVVYIDAPAAMRAQRIANRGRESADDVNSRLVQTSSAFDATEADLLIMNDGDPEVGAGRLFRYLVF